MFRSPLPWATGLCLLTALALAPLPGQVVHAQSAPEGTAIVTSVENLTPWAATLMGEFVPDATLPPQNRQAWFEWGSNTNYGNQTPVHQIEGGATNAVLLSQSITNLAMGGGYHARMVVSNETGVVVSSNFSFQTPSALPSGFIWGARPVGSNACLIYLYAHSYQRTNTQLWIEYGTNESLGQVCVSTDPRLYAEIMLTNLISPGQSYFYRFVMTTPYSHFTSSVARFQTPIFFVEETKGPDLGVRTQCLGMAGAWGDYDNDNKLDLLISGERDLTNVFELWRYTDEGFIKVPAPFPQLWAASFAWGDFDNDNRLDIVLAGYPSEGFDTIWQVWRNTPQGFTNMNVPLPDLKGRDRTPRRHQTGWIDYDNDGRLDIYLMGTVTGAVNRTCHIWRNTGNGFTPVQINLDSASASISCGAWGDYNNDGWIDLAGSYFGYQVSGQIWENNGTNFIRKEAPFPGIDYPGVSPTDFDSDGRLDLLLAGNSSFRGGQIVEVWRNSGNSFAPHLTNLLSSLNLNVPARPNWADVDQNGFPDLALGSASSGGGRNPRLFLNTGSNLQETLGMPSATGPAAAAWGDYDNDGRLDLFGGDALFDTQQGYSPGQQYELIWKNFRPSTNAAPFPPSDLASLPAGDRVILRWGTGSDQETPRAGLAYNLRIGTTPGGCEIVNPQAELATGRKRVPDLGNCQLSHTKTITDLKPGVYYWSVQAVDNGFSGGRFSEERSFSIGGASRIHGLGRTIAGEVHLDIRGAENNLYDVFGSTNALLPLSQWSFLGRAQETNPGEYRYLAPTTNSASFFQLRTARPF